MKIAHLTSVHPACDARILYKEAASLAAAGHDVVLIARAERDSTVQGVRIRAVAAGARRRWQRMSRAVLAVLRAAQDERADVYHFHDPELIPAGLWLKLRGKRVVYDVHDDLPDQILSKVWIRPWLRRPAAGAAAALEAVAGTLLDGIVVANPAHGRRFPAAKTIAVRNLPRLDEFAPPADPLPYASRPLRLAYVGGLTAVRGAREMVRALEHLPADVTLALAGRFDEPGLEAACRALPAWPRVDFRGWQSRRAVADLLGRVRVGLVLLHPVAHYRANYPIKLFEYMAAGLPVVAADLPLCREVIEETGAGLLADPLDPAAIAATVRRLLDRPDEAEAMGRRGRRAVEQRYNWNGERQKLIAWYERLQPAGRAAATSATPP